MNVPDDLRARGVTKLQKEKPKKYFVRTPPQGELVEVMGYPFTIPLLPNHEFFTFHASQGWRVTEAKSGFKFPIIELPTRKEQEEATLSFVERRGRIECERVFKQAIQRFGPIHGN